MAERVLEGRASQQLLDGGLLRGLLEMALENIDLGGGLSGHSCDANLSTMRIRGGGGRGGGGRDGAAMARRLEGVLLGEGEVA